MATIVSHSLVVLCGYLLYTFSTGCNEAHLSLMIRFILSPAIAILTGTLVGLLSRDHPVPTSIIGLVPWIFNLLGPDKPTWSWLGAGVVYIALGAIAALLAFQLRHRDDFANMANAGLKTQ